VFVAGFVELGVAEILDHLHQDCFGADVVVLVVEVRFRGFVEFREDVRVDLTAEVPEDAAVFEADVPLDALEGFGGLEGGGTARMLGWLACMAGG
jgi:hypothetical protein